MVRIHNRQYSLDERGGLIMNLFTSVAENAIFVLEFLGIVLAIFAVAYLFEKLAKKKNNDTERILNTKTIVVIGMFSAIACVLHIFDFSVGFAPDFYKLDLSEIPVMICAFAYGPVAGVMVEFVKIVLKLFIKGTSTAFVGDLANFVIGCSFVLPASIIYRFKKSKKNAIISCIIGTLVITIAGPVFNALYLLPAFAKLYGWPLEDIIAIGTAINPAIKDVTTLVIFAVAPLNLLKGAIVSIVTIFIYKPLSRLLK